MLKIYDVRKGDKLVADAGFTCLAHGQIVEVTQTSDGLLAIRCADGAHLLDGQDEQGELIGLDRAEGQDACRTGI